MLDRVVVGGVTDDARGLFRQAADTLVAAHASRQFPWIPFNVSSISSEEAIQRGMGALDGFLPASYGGDRGRGEADVELVDPDLTKELTAEIDRIMPAESQLWEAEAYRNLALLLRYASQNDGYRIMA